MFAAFIHWDIDGVFYMILLFIVFHTPTGSFFYLNLVETSPDSVIAFIYLSGAFIGSFLDWIQGVLIASIDLGGVLFIYGLLSIGSILYVIFILSIRHNVVSKQELIISVVL